ncbi:MAG: hypothetical protein M5R42_05575 [Rhodocyclaceae bacterium]|nr:hypothetical protein [Rhodocyclaceae bacterium]
MNRRLAAPALRRGLQFGHAASWAAGVERLFAGLPDISARVQ